MEMPFDSRLCQIISTDDGGCGVISDNEEHNLRIITCCGGEMMR